MIKNALLPLQFYPALSWTDYERYTKKMGDDFVLLKEHHIFFPAFQMTIPDIGRHWGILDITTFDCINYDDGTTYNLLLNFKQPVVYNKAGDFRSLVNWRFPLDYVDVVANFIPDGKYYYHVGDGETEWFSEIFEICDLSTDAFTAEFDNEVNMATWVANYFPVSDRNNFQFCHAAASGDASAYTEVEVFLEEELDLYVHTRGASFPCGAVSWGDPIYFELRDASGLVVSETVAVAGATGAGAQSVWTFSLTSQVGGTVRLYMYILNADDTQGVCQVYLQRRYAENHIQLRYSNSVNICKIFYEDDYENVFFLDAKQVIDQNVIEETVVEDDAVNKSRIIGTNQKWNSIQFVAGEAMLNAMSLLRLHNEIKIIRETGEVMDIVEILMEQSVIDYEASKIKLIYREESCSVEACGFDDCCPTLNTPIMQDAYSGVGALPAAAAGNDGWYAIVNTGADEWEIYLSNGVAWAVNNDFDVEDDCIEARQNTFNGGNRFWWFDTGGGVNRWRSFIDQTTPIDNTDGTAGIVTDTEYRDGLTVRGEFQDADGVWNECTDTELLVAGGGSINMTCRCGVGTFNFRIHVWTDSCDYGYSQVISQTIT